MNPEEHARLAVVAETHWFYKGKRAIVKARLRSLVPGDGSAVLVDIGAGGGLLVRESAADFYAVGIEPYFDAIPRSRGNSPAGRVLGGSALALPLKDQVADAVTCLDVLEHIRDDGRALAEAVRVTRRNGVLVLTVPAFSWAMTDWDAALGHLRRYDRRDIRKLLKDLPVRIVDMRYVNNVPFFPVIVYRFFRKMFLPGNCSRWEDRVPPDIINNWLYRIFVRTALWQGVRWPFGLSLLIVLKRL